MQPVNPSFQQIAELFQINLPGESPAEVVPPKKLKGEDASESAELGRTALGQGDFEAAIKHFRNAVQQRSTADADDAIDLGAAYEYADQAPQAYRQYQKARRLRSNEAEPLVGLSDLFRRHGRYKDSVLQLEEALSLDPNSPYLHLKLAETLRDMGERSRALAAAQKAVVAKPDDWFYHYWIGDLLIEMGRPDDALESLRAAIELSPGDDFLYLRAAVAFWSAGRRPEAIKAVRLASDLDTAKNVYHGLLEALLEECGMLEEADLESARADQMDRFDHDLLKRTLAEMGLDA